MFPKAGQRFILSSIFVLLLVAGATALLRAQTAPTPPLQPYLVKEINTASRSSSPRDGIVLNDIVYFVADDGQHDLELWWSDGQTAALLKDIYPFENVGWPAPTVQPESLTIVGNQFFFLANDGEHGQELWRSDGTTEGTVMVKDIEPGERGSEIRYLTAVGGSLFFSTNSNTDAAPTKLWRSDGTASGTEPFFENPDVLFLQELTAVGNSLYFVTSTEDYVITLWITDGTAANTRAIKNDFFWLPDQLTAVVTAAGDNILYFSADDGTGEGLWRSDGTTAGTQLVFNQTENGFPFVIRSLRAHQNELYFTNSLEDQLWISDGTMAGTQKLLEAAYIELPSAHFPTHSFYFAAWTEQGIEPWQTDGTVAGTQLVADIYPGSESSYPFGYTYWQQSLYFTAKSPDNGRELWRIDETGAALAADLVSGAASSSPGMLLPAAHSLFLSAYHPDVGSELWQLAPDHTANVVADINTLTRGANPQQLTAVNDLVLFTANSSGEHGLWRSDGTAPGTYLLKAINNDSDDKIRELTKLEDNLYFVIRNGYQEYNAEGLWRTDGTLEGTELVLATTDEFANLWQLTAANDTLYFIADTPEFGQELWRSDGTAAGTSMVADATDGPDSSYFTYLTPVNDTLFFTKQDYETEKSLWKSDGSSVELVKVINSAPYANGPTQLTAVGEQLFFVADDGQHGTELWVSDGTSDGTRLVKDIAPDEQGADPTRLLNNNGTLYFFAREQTDFQLWRSDGTEAGTKRISLSTGAVTSYPGPGEVAATGDRFYFVSNDGQLGEELWESDGTAAGTKLVADIYQGEEGSFPAHLTAGGNTLFFSAQEPENGREYWYTTGAESGVTLLQDINAGQNDSAPYYWYDKQAVAVGHKLFFAADNGNGNVELWAVSTLGHRFYLTFVPQE